MPGLDLPRYDTHSAIQTNELACPFCRCKNTRPVYAVVNHSFYCCNRCQSLFGPDADKASEIAYDKEYYGDSLSEKFWFTPAVWLLNAERSRRARYLSRFLKPGDPALDIGCGNGALLQKIHLLSGARAVGVEMDNVAAQRAKKRGCIEVYFHSFEQADLKEKSFRTVSMIHSFEHIPRPGNTFYKAAGLLTPGGVLYLAIPNIDSWQYRLFGKYWLHLDPEYHLHFPSRESVMQLASQNGLTEMKTIHYIPVQNISGFVFSTLNRMSGRRDLLFNLLRNRKMLRKTGNVAAFVFLMMAAVVLFPIAALFEACAALSLHGATVDYIFRKQE